MNTIKADAIMWAAAMAVIEIDPPQLLSVPRQSVVRAAERGKIASA